MGKQSIADIHFQPSRRGAHQIHASRAPEVRRHNLCGSRQFNHCHLGQSMIDCFMMMFCITYDSTRPAGHDPNWGCRSNPDGAGRGLS
jgi:hypothetical protein